MKKLKYVMMLAMMGVSVASYAWYAKLSDPWSVIQKDDSLVISWPDVNGLPINNACVAEDSFRSINGVQYCVREEVTREACRYHGEVELCRMLKPGEEPGRWDTVREHRRCVETAMKYVSVPRTYTTQDCIEWVIPSEANSGGCVRYGQPYTKDYPTSFSVRIDRVWSQEQGPQYFGNKQFDMPACGK
jgi:hypothetical protein